MEPIHKIDLDLDEYDEDTEFDFEAIKEYLYHISEEVVDLDPAFIKIVEENFWNLLA